MPKFGPGASKVDLLGVAATSIRYSVRSTGCYYCLRPEAFALSLRTRLAHSLSQNTNTLFLRLLLQCTYYSLITIQSCVLLVSLPMLAAFSWSLLASPNISRLPPPPHLTYPHTRSLMQRVHSRATDLSPQQ